MGYSLDGPFTLYNDDSSRFCSKLCGRGETSEEITRSTRVIFLGENSSHFFFLFRVASVASKSKKCISIEYPTFIRVFVQISLKRTRFSDRVHAGEEKRRP